MKKTLLAAVALLAFAASSSAQDGVAVGNANASATIIAPLSIVKAADLNFGNIVVTTGGTVTVDTAGARTASTGVTLPTGNPGTVTAASFTVTGTAGYTFAVLLPTTLQIQHSVTGTDAMGLSLFTSSTSRVIGGAGTQVLNVGATLTVGLAQLPGLYTNDFDVSVNYN